MKLSYTGCTIIAAVLAILTCTTGMAAQVTLDNGLEIVAVQNVASDVAAVHIALKIGPERVPAHKAGLRALTQQVLLNRIRSVMKDRDDLAALRQEGTQGAGFGVETQWDHVEFAGSVTSRLLPTLLKFMAEAVFAAEWTEDDIVEAKDILTREKLAADSPQTASYEDAYLLFRKALVGDSPLAQPMFGTDKTLDAITLADVKSFYRSYYVPNVACVCLVAPLPEDEQVALIRQHLGEYKPRELGKTEAIRLGADESKVEIGASPALDSALVVVGVPLSPLGTDGYVIGQVLHAALSGPRGAFAEDKSLSTSLPLASRIASRGAMSFGVLPIELSRAPYLAAFAKSTPISVEAVRTGILGRILKYAQEPMSDEELARAKTRAINLYTQPMTLPQIAASAICRRFLLTGDTEDETEFSQQVAALTAEQIQQYAKTQFTRHAIGVMMPGG